MPCHVKKKDWCVARRPGQRLFLAGSVPGELSFSGLSPSTVFFLDSEFESGLERLGVKDLGLVKTPVVLEMRV